MRELRALTYSLRRCGTDATPQRQDDRSDTIGADGVAAVEREPRRRDAAMGTCTRATVSRRRFVGSASAAVAAALGLPPVTAAETRLPPSRVQFTPEIEPLVQFLEETPRGDVIEAVVARIQRGLTYRELVTALFLAGLRDIPGAALAPHRNVGGHLHTVLMVHSALLAGVASAVM